VLPPTPERPEATAGASAELAPVTTMLPTALLVGLLAALPSELATLERPEETVGATGAVGGGVAPSSGVPLAADKPPAVTPVIPARNRVSSNPRPCAMLDAADPPAAPRPVPSAPANGPPTIGNKAAPAAGSAKSASVPRKLRGGVSEATLNGFPDVGSTPTTDQLAFLPIVADRSCDACHTCSRPAWPVPDEMTFPVLLSTRA